MRDWPIGGQGGSGFGAGEPQDGAPGDGSRRSTGRPVEIVGPHLRITGRLELGSFQRVTDLVNSTSGLFRLTQASVLLRDGQPSNLAVGDLWVSPAEVTVIAEMEPLRDRRAKDIVFVSKSPTPLAIVTPGHTVTGVLKPVAAHHHLKVEELLQKLCL